MHGIKQCYVKVKKVNSGEKEREKKIKRKRLSDEYNDTKENRAKAAATHESLSEHRVMVKQCYMKILDINPSKHRKEKTEGIAETEGSVRYSEKASDYCKFGCQLCNFVSPYYGPVDHHVQERHFEFSDNKKSDGCMYVDRVRHVCKIC